MTSRVEFRWRSSWIDSRQTVLILDHHHQPKASEVPAELERALVRIYEFILGDRSRWGECELEMFDIGKRFRATAPTILLLVACWLNLTGTSGSSIHDESLAAQRFKSGMKLRVLYVNLPDKHPS